MDSSNLKANRAHLPATHPRAGANVSATIRGGGGGRPNPITSSMETVGGSTTTPRPTPSSPSKGPSTMGTGSGKTPANDAKSVRRRPSGPALLWDIAADEASDKSHIENKETSIIVVGGKGAGKTTLLNSFLEKKESPRETVALECSFGRKMQLGKMTRDIAQFWELGGGTTYLSLLEVAITRPRLSNMILIIVVDFSEPKEIWNLITTLHDQVARRIVTLRGRGDDLAADRIRRLFQDFTMADVSERCPSQIPVLIVANKYDEFHNMNGDERRTLVSCLRILSIYFGAALLFTDRKTRNLITRFKAFVSHLCFDHSPPNGIVVDHKNPVLAPWGKDTCESVGIPPKTTPNWKYPSDKRLSYVEMWRRSFEEIFKTSAHLPVQWQQHLQRRQHKDVNAAFEILEVESAAASQIEADPSLVFPESAIDAARQAKKYEIERRRREKEKEERDKEEKVRNEKEESWKKDGEDRKRGSNNSDELSGLDVRSNEGSNPSDLGPSAMETIAEDERDQDGAFS